MNNPFAQPMAQQMTAQPFNGNPFATPAAAPAQPPVAPPPSPGVQAIQAAFAAQPAAQPATHGGNPFAAGPSQVGPGVAPQNQQQLSFPPMNPPGEAGLGGPAPSATPAAAESPAPAQPAAPVEPDPPARGRGRPRKSRPAPIEAAHPAEDLGTEATPGVAVHQFAAEGLGAFTTEQLRDELKNRGWAVRLEDA